jgi:hypothetical protein
LVLVVLALRQVEQTVQMEVIQNLEALLQQVAVVAVVPRGQEILVPVVVLAEVHHRFQQMVALEHLIKGMQVVLVPARQIIIVALAAAELVP